ncbi:MAG TPA: biotin--[acetyl-CoA-carboxylase] ligase [bacterium]|nr:biotin--[acetyl-CoA-carboxylase] ligase [bacterium]
MSAHRLPNIGTRLIGRYIRWHESLPSTNDVALRLADVGVPEGTVIVAEEQTAGRGRRGRAWASPRGGIWLSVILRPGIPVERVPLIALSAAAATAQAIREATGLPARVKWPNDVLVDGKKIVGILAEAGAGGEWVVVGIGINANIPLEALPQATGSPATSLQALGHPVDQEALITLVLRELEGAYDLLKSGGFRATLRRWREMTDTLGRPVRVEMPDAAIEGVAQDIDETGALLVRLEGGSVRRVVAGDLRVREAGP